MTKNPTKLLAPRARLAPQSTPGGGAGGVRMQAQMLPGAYFDPKCFRTHELPLVNDRVRLVSVANFVGTAPQSDLRGLPFLAHTAVSPPDFFMWIAYAFWFRICFSYVMER